MQFYRKKKVQHLECNLYLIRHGQSLCNFKRNFLGHTDWDLTELGYKQADCVAQYFEKILVDAIYSSDLIRAQHTVVPLAKDKGLEIATDRNLREIYAGLWEGQNYQFIEEKTPNEWALWQRADSENMGPAQGESVKQLLSRVYDTLQKIAAQNDGKTVIVALHATPIRVVTNHILGKSLCELYSTPWVANASITKLQFKEGEFEIEFTNECSHLGDIVTVLPKNI